MKLDWPKGEEYHKRSYAEKLIGSIHEYINKGKKTQKNSKNTTEQRTQPKKPKGMQAKQEKTKLGKPEGFSTHTIITN